MTTPLQAYQVTVTDPRTGPRGGKAKPVISNYVVTATSREEALALFADEMASAFGEHSQVQAFACGCRVLGGR
jgi:hypothetical protein